MRYLTTCDGSLTGMTTSIRTAQLTGRTASISEEHSSTHVPTVPGDRAGHCPTDTEKMSNHLDCKQYQMFLITHDSDVFTNISNEL